MDASGALICNIRNKEAIVNVELNPEENKLVQEVLSSYLSDLSYEIRNTDSQDYRNGLKERAEVLKNVLHELESKQH